ncbi:hypothetical protein OTB20_26645 [Streptomyces sp. H27-H1]|uniref:hypothetical protein n=1 Tax=Streptomyces sp. H27-H1 TaxID=2996461 RepID=UPI00226EE9DB|nr:hypothetical protein [Streptomyces sp. H27-H1]MCY0929707.1 hypothetical protein [Streptomyces sp. H27-H1]
MFSFSGPADDGTPPGHSLRGHGTISVSPAEGGWQPTFVWSGRGEPAHPAGGLALRAGADVLTRAGQPLLEFRMRRTLPPAYSFGHTRGERIPAGAYNVRWWTVREEDGVRVGGSFGFELG